MMSLPTLLTRLRIERDQLTTVIDVLSRYAETPETAQRLIERMVKSEAPAKPPKAAKPVATRKRRKSTKPHWSQTPAGRKRLSEIMRTRYRKFGGLTNGGKP